MPRSQIQWFVVGENLKRLRDERKISQEQLAVKSGISSASLSDYERGFKAKEATCRALARALGVSFEDLIGADRVSDATGTYRSNLPPGAEPLPSRWVKIPLLGQAPASAKQVVHDEVVEEVPVPHDVVRKYGRTYALRVRGDSMNRTGIEDGDTVLVAADWRPENGKIVVAVVDGECCLKRWHKTDHSVTLIPDSTNPKHQPQVFTRANDVQCRGVVVEVWRKLVK